MKYVKLKDLISISHGYAFKGEFFSNDEKKFVLVTPGNFNIGGGFKVDKFRYYDGEVPKRYVLNENDIIVTMTDLSKSADTLGYSAKVPNIKNKLFLHNQRIGKLDKKSELVSLDFIYWLMRTHGFHEFVIGSASGSTVKHTSPNRILEYEFYLPGINEQKIISSALSSFEDKIELLEKQNETLEKIGEALFKHWFVDFEFPNEKGLPYKLSGGKMVYNEELEKEIPEGWKTDYFKNVADADWGDTKVTKNSYVSEGFVTFSASGPDGFRDKWDYDKVGIVVSAIGAYFGKTWLAFGKWSCIKNTIRIFGTLLSTEYLFFLTKSDSFWKRRGAAQPFISKGDINSTKIFIPAESIVFKFDNIVKVNLIKINENKLEIIYLKQLCDLLLPKLMCGKIRVG